MTFTVYNKILERTLTVKCYSNLGRRLPVCLDLLDVLIDILKSRIKTHHQNTIGIIGRTSTGKSNLAADIAIAMDPYFSVQSNYIISPQDLARKLCKDLHTVSPVNWFDEGSVILNSSNHSKKESIELTTLFDIMRSWEMTSIFCVPKIRTLNNRIRDDHIDYLLTCGKSPLRGFAARGFFKLYVRSEASEFQESIYWYPVAWGIFPKMPLRMEKQYLPLKAETQKRYKELLVKQYLDDEEDGLE